MKYKRILLKLSGEALQGSTKSTNIDPKVLEQYCEEIKLLRAEGIEIAIVIGGGNIFRGGQAEALGIDRVQGDYMGMLATEDIPSANNNGYFNALSAQQLDF